MKEANETVRFRRVLSKHPKILGNVQKGNGTRAENSADTFNHLATIHFPGCVNDAVIRKVI